jgi:hypothetical protein
MQPLQLHNICIKTTSDEILDLLILLLEYRFAEDKELIKSFPQLNLWPDIQICY